MGVKELFTGFPGRVKDDVQDAVSRVKNFPSNVKRDGIVATILDVPKGTFLFVREVNARRGRDLWTGLGDGAKVGGRKFRFFSE